MWRAALESRNAGRLHEAEAALQQVYSGLSHILGRTNEDTVKAAYNLADLYAVSNRMDKAIDSVESVIQNHLEVCGCKDRKTQQVIFTVVELLNGWNRQADALGLLSLSKELLHSISGARDTPRPKVGGRTSRKGKAVQRPTPNGSQQDLSRVIEAVNNDMDPTRIDHGLAVARSRVAAKDPATEGLLLAIILQCENSPDLGIQHLKAQAELLKHYEISGQAKEHETAFEDALESLERAWAIYEWEEDSIESLDFIEAALQVIANTLKCGYRAQTRLLFRKVSEKACDVFGFNDERSVWVLITIGLVYQTHMAWEKAEEWFEEAFSAALANPAWGPKDGIVRSLQNAMDRHYFSYVSDEGRPYKTIFGVSGLTILPGRLHLE